ncbi:TetR/AcrR family transcriptional regulator [Streptomyces africanus]|uniref:TetR/AcrR family transcriptional regulator n=1 Tax=Streptomyces africanus TaxID=231024 RepID=UPI000A3A7C28|nr:TetR/AcrR family transcriptional regulator [Streptomyces africanus]
MKQARAARTRQALVQAAATEFDRKGYDGASLTRISRTAGVSMGALTFHFASEQELAEAVCAEGEEITRAVVQRMVGAGEPALQAAVALTLALVVLLEDEARVRAAARLARERRAEQPDAWTELWEPVLRERLRSASLQEPGGGVDPAAVATLCLLLVRGAETTVREHVLTCGTPAQDVIGQFSDVWRLVLKGVSAAPGTGSGRAGERRAIPRPSRSG